MACLLFKTTKRAYSQSVEIANGNYVKLIQDLYKENSDHSMIVENAFKIYNKASLKTADIIAAVLKVCLTCKKIEKCKSIWSDVKLLSQQPLQPDFVTVYLLFLKCCTKSRNDLKIDECIDVLKLIQECPYFICQEYDFRDYSMSMSIIIAECSKYDTDKLNVVYALSEEINIEDVFIKTAFINAFAKRNNIDKAMNIFNTLKNENKDSAVVNVMIKWLIKFNRYEDALVVYDEHLWLHDDVTNILVLRVFQHFDYLDRAQFVSQSIGKNTHINLKNALIDFYGHFGEVDNALQIFSEIGKDEMDKITLGSIIKCLVNNELNQEALDLYDEFETFHDVQTHLYAIKACSCSNNYEKGKKIRSKIESDDPFVCSVLIDFYGNFGAVLTAQRIFYSMPLRMRDTAMIASMMDAYTKCNMNYEALDLFRSMQKPDLICFVIAIKACANGTFYHFGVELHERMKNDHSLKQMLNDRQMESALITFYGKSGKMEVAKNIFEESQNKKNIALWNAMINAHGKNGDVKSAKEVLFNCLKAGVIADVHTFVFLINACSHCGDVDDAKVIWEEAISDGDIKYNRYVMTSLVDCLSRNGRFEEAKQCIIEYEGNCVHHHYPMWLAYFSSYCRNFDQFGNISVAESVHNEMKKRFNGKEMRAASILLSSLYEKHRIIMDESPM